MAQYEFKDDWIADAALTTLGWHAQGRAVPGLWYSMPDLAEEMQITIVWDRCSRETLDHFRKRSAQMFKRSRAQYIKRMQARWGDRTQKHVEQHARWTALFFRGDRYGQIADMEGRAGHGVLGEDTIRKAVKSFIRRIGLTMPNG